MAAETTPVTAARFLVVIGTRPEGIKLAPVISALRARREVDVRVALTGQHSALMDQVLDVFGLEPDWDLGIMREGQDLYDVAHACLDGLRTVVSEWRPDGIVVEGDTASVFLGSLVAFFERIRVVHVEAGLRSGDAWPQPPAAAFPDPWPEEMLRRLTGVVADLHFAPTPLARKNLLAEGIDPARVFVTGNPVVDALNSVVRQAYDIRNADLAAALSTGRRIVLVTAHRRESFGEPMRHAFHALRAVADRFDDVELLYPVHPNPNVRSMAGEVLAGHPRIRLTQPLDYRDLVLALSRSTLVMTDSGGIQEEAPAFGVPVLVMRNVTERPEGVEAGVAALVGTDARAIEDLATTLLATGDWSAIRRYNRLRIEGASPARAATAVVADTRRPDSAVRDAFPNPYGDGRAGERIADVLVHRFTGAFRTTADWPGAGEEAIGVP
ncbi:MAG: non-hydrolyzing UDP-N-acetylglucosamine 2-epimerase [Longimicrobiales bacterium]